MSYLKVGTITSTRGLKGEVRVFSSSDFTSLRFKKGSKLLVKPLDSEELREVKVKSHSFDGKFDIVSFEGYETIESVTPLLKGDLLIIKEEHPLKNGYYYYSDLMSCMVYEDDKEIGSVLKVEEYNNKISLRIKVNDKTILLPFHENFIKNVDIEKKRIDVKLIEGML